MQIKATSAVSGMHNNRCSKYLVNRYDLFPYKHLCRMQIPTESGEDPFFLFRLSCHKPRKETLYILYLQQKLPE